MPEAKIAPIIILLALSAVAWCQESDPEIIGVLVPRAQQDAVQRLELSKSRENYPVTPGDIYTISYRTASREVKNEILVESDYTLNLNVFGRIKGEGLTFPQLKQRVEKMVNDAYPNSLPYLSIDSVGMFEVYLTGEVPKTQFVAAWGLSRLSEVVLPHLTANSSIRDVTIAAVGGRSKSYDLFKAINKGALEENPFVRLGDTILIRPRSRQIELQGEILRPGEYQLLPGETLKEVVEYYGGGFTALADRGRVKLMRVSGENPRTSYHDLREDAMLAVPLEDEDIIDVPSKLDALPTVAFEGAVIPDATAPAPVPAPRPAGTEQQYERITHSFALGETLKDALSAVKQSISPSADLKHAHILRGENSLIIPVDIVRLLSEKDPADNPVLQPGDRVIIPPFRFYVSVVGAVLSPGTFPYMPQRTYAYYLTLAGGIPTGPNPANIAIVDADGRPRELDSPLLPEDRIIVTELLIPVAGGVYRAGAYTFVPGKSYEYYLNLAGGINPEVNSWNRVSIQRADRDNRGKKLPIEPGDRIFVHSNDFLYNFNRYFPIISSGAALVTAVLTIITYAQRQ